MKDTIHDQVFAGHNLRDANLKRARYIGCDFRDADCTGVSFALAEFENCQFGGAMFRSANLTSTWFISCDLSAANLTDADLSGARLNNVKLRQADLSGVLAAKLEVTDSDARGSRWVGSTLRNTRLGNTDLTSAVFDRAFLEGTEITGCDLRGASVASARIDHLKLDDCQVADLQGVPLEPWSMLAWNLDVTGNADGLFTRWYELRGPSKDAIPYRLMPPRVDDGTVLAIILDAAPDLEASLGLGDLVFPVESSVFEQRLLAMPAKNPQRMIYVGLLDGNDGLLLEDTPENLTRLARAVGVRVEGSEQAKLYARLGYHLAAGAKRADVLRSVVDEQTADGWQIRAEAGASAVTIDVLRDGAITIHRGDTT